MENEVKAPISEETRREYLRLMEILKQKEAERKAKATPGGSPSTRGDSEENT